MDLQSLFKLIVSNNLGACIRGMYYAVRYGRSSCRTMVFHQLRITPQYIKLDRGVRLCNKSCYECVYWESKYQISFIGLTERQYRTKLSYYLW